MQVHDLNAPRNLVRQSQVDDLRRLVGSIAHEMNNSHQVIRGRVEIAIEEAEKEGTRRDSLLKAQMQVDEASLLIQRLMTYAQVYREVGEPVPFLLIVGNVVQALNAIVDEQNLENLSQHSTTFRVR